MRVHMVRVFAVIFLVLFSGIAITASAKRIYVPDNYAKIQWAVDNASAGDTIIEITADYE